MATPEQQADPDAMMAALDRLRDALFLAKDEAGRTGTVEPVRARELVILCADVYLISNRDEVEARMDRRLGENKAPA